MKSLYLLLVGMLAIGSACGVFTNANAQQTNHEIQFYVLGEKYPKGLSDFQAFGLFRTVEGGKVKLQG